MSTTIDKFMRHRRAALLSMDEGKIRRFMEKWSPASGIPAGKQVFWIGVHKARTAVLDLPEAERLRSHQWLAAKRAVEFVACSVADAGRHGDRAEHRVVR
jgi:hypothetical protein